VEQEEVVEEEEVLVVEGIEGEEEEHSHRSCLGRVQGGPRKLD